MIHGYRQLQIIEENSFVMNKAKSEIQLDGVLDEEAWKNADKADNFHQYFPFDTSYAEAQTKMILTYDDEFIYIATICKDLKSGDYVTSSLKRDYRGLGNDGISIILDTFDDGNNAFFFGLTPYNVQREALISNGGNGRGSFSLSWDNKWYSATKIYDNYWIGEIAIPFKSIRYKEGSTQWGANFYRIDSKQNERSTWVHIPRNFLIFSLAYTGKMIWDQPLEKPGANISVIPYVSGAIDKNHEENENTNYASNIGADAKVAISPSLNLDITVNPDFSQVEVDRQVTNLDRFELFFPERRQFFLENADLFGSFGTARTRPFFSRRIGIARDTVNDVTVANNIHFGLRLSGKINQDWRIGLLNMQTSKDRKIGLESTNYTVGVIQRRLFERSTISAFLVNKQILKDTVSDKFTLNPQLFNRVVGLEYNLATNNNKWAGKLFYHKSFTPGNADKEFVHGLNLEFRERKFNLEWDHQIVGENYSAEVGFVPRKGFNRINPAFRLNYFPNNKLINEHGPGLTYEQIWDNTNGKTDHQLALTYRINFQNTSRLSLQMSNQYTFLFASFDPSRSGGTALPEDSDYSYNNFEASYQSDQRKSVFFETSVSGGEFFNGNIFSFSGNLNYRYQPFAIFSVNYSYDRIRLPKPYAEADLWLIGPKIDLTFTRNLFFTTFVQYNNQQDNLNINARFQWRFKPVSDLFIVYTDNYLPNNFTVKNRGLVVKLTYWINV